MYEICNLEQEPKCIIHIMCTIVDVHFVRNCLVKNGDVTATVTWKTINTINIFPVFSVLYKT